MGTGASTENVQIETDIYNNTEDINKIKSDIYYIKNDIIDIKNYTEDIKNNVDLLKSKLKNSLNKTYNNIESIKDILIILSDDVNNEDKKNIVKDLIDIIEKNLDLIPLQENFSNSKKINYLLITLIIIFIIILILFFP